jgi:hypothetical protein
MVSEIVDFFMAPLLRIPIERIVAETIDVHEPDIIELNLAQLAAGKTAEGADIKPFYKPKTIAFRRSKGKQTDHVDLNMDGNFYKGTFAKRTGDGTEIGSVDGKTPFLEGRYTVDIFGLSVASRDELEARLKPTLQDKFNQAIL